MIKVDFRSAEVLKGGRAVKLTARELQLLRYFVDHRNAALSRDELLREVWGYTAATYTRTVDVHIASLRQKIEDDPIRPSLITTVSGIGYRFEG